MNTRTLGLVIIFVALVLNASAWANNSRTLPVRTEVTLNGIKLPPGYYEIGWVSHSPEATVTLARAGRTVVTARGKWVERGIRYNADAVVYTNNPDGSHTLLEIRFAGRKQALVFAEVN